VRNIMMEKRKWNWLRSKADQNSCMTPLSKKVSIILGSNLGDNCTKVLGSPYLLLMWKN
jgi:hypothetical protein